MTSTPLDTETAPDVRDLDASAVLDAVVAARRTADQAEADLLALAVHWVDLHPVTDEHPAATFPTQRSGGLASAWVRRSSTRHRWPVTGRRASRSTRWRSSRRRSGSRTPRVWRWSRRRSSSASGSRALWALVQDGRLQAWKARQVAKATTQLSREAVAFVDRHLAVTGRRNRLPVLNPVLHEARLRCDPDQAAAVEQHALDHRGVWLDHRESTATTLVTARLDTLDALDLDGSVSDLAGLMGRLGDARPLDVRQACALGMLAHPQRALDLATGTRAPIPGRRARFRG